MFTIFFYILSISFELLTQSTIYDEIDHKHVASLSIFLQCIHNSSSISSARSVAHPFPINGPLTASKYARNKLNAVA